MIFKRLRDSNKIRSPLLRALNKSRLRPVKSDFCKKVLILFIFMPQVFFWNELSRAESNEKIKIITTWPDLAEAARVIGGQHVEVEALLEGTENAHFLDAVPSFIKKVSLADVVCLAGLGLEMGWMPKVLAKSGKAQVQPGGIGYCEAGLYVSALQKPQGLVDRSMGDVHPAGNPHFNLNPKTLAQGSIALRDALIRLRPHLSEEFNSNYNSFTATMDRLHASIQKKLKPLLTKRPIFIEYHRDFTYFFDAYQLQLFDSIEEKPGVPPSAGRLAKISLEAQKTQVKLAIGSPYSPERHLKRFSELSGIPFKKIPTMVQPKNKYLNSIDKLQNHIADVLLQGAQ